MSVETLPPYTSLGGSATTPSDPTPVVGQSSYNITIGSTTQMDMTPQSDGSVRISLGSNSSSNEIFLNGGIRYNVTTKSDTGTSYTITDNDYMIIFTSATYTSVVVPVSLSRTGKVYVIIRRFGNFLVTPSGGDNFDGIGTLSLPETGTRVQIIADGISAWNTL
jgi:flagellar basal body rod protein FlgG